jgi:hypothetical protein
VNVANDELDLWRKSMPTLVECARNDWSHTAGCEYLPKRETAISSTEQQLLIPLSLDVGKASLCSCCVGRGLGGCVEFEEFLGKKDQNILRYFSRIAISPIYDPLASF